MFAFVCHPYHRGGVTRWMIDASIEAAGRSYPSFLIAPRPTRPFLSAGEHPLVMDVLEEADPGRHVVRVGVRVGARYEFGTTAYRASVLLGAIRRSVPAGTAIVPSDDAGSWAAACGAGPEYRVIGVLHADDEHYYKLAQRHHREVAGFVCVSGRIEAKLRQRLPDLTAAVRRIPCGIPLGDSPSVTPEVPPAVRIVWAGRIEQRQKRVSDLAGILERVVATGMNASLEIIGGGPDREVLRKEFVARGVAGRVTWTGWVSSAHVRQHMAKADVFLLPSNFEGMPVAAMEALASGCAVVASEASGLEEFARHPHAVNCLRVFPVGDIEAAARALRSVLTSARAARIGAARSIASTEFSIQACMSRYEEMERALRRPGGSMGAAPTWARTAWMASLPITAVRGLRVWLARYFAVAGAPRT